MKTKNLNKGSEKTRKLIKDSFAIILKEKKDITKVTVKEITALADIDRTTFYTHFSSIYDVAKDYENEVISTFFIDNEDIYDFNLFLDKVFKFLEANDEIYKMLLVSPDTDFFMDSLKLKLINKLENNLKIDKYKIIFFSNGTIGLFLDYYRKNYKNLSLDKIKQTIKEIYRALLENN